MNKFLRNNEKQKLSNRFLKSQWRRYKRTVLNKAFSINLRLSRNKLSSRRKDQGLKSYS